MQRSQIIWKPSKDFKKKKKWWIILFFFKFKKTEYDETANSEMSVWSEYIEHEKQFKKKERTAFIYEKALITQVSLNLETILIY